MLPGNGMNSLATIPINRAMIKNFKSCAIFRSWLPVER